MLHLELVWGETLMWVPELRVRLALGPVLILLGVWGLVWAGMAGLVLVEWEV